MTDLPKILVGGFLNSGTSFLCELIVKMGFSPGSSRWLKAADAHNPWGYWEHKRLKAAIRTPTRYRELLHPMRSAFPLKSAVYDERIARRVREIAEADNVEVFKDTGLPILWRFFPASRCVLVKRSWKTIWEKYYDGKYPPIKVARAHDEYYRLARVEMARHVSCLLVEYEDFATDFDNAAKEVAQFVGADVNVKKLRGVFRR